MPLTDKQIFLLSWLSKEESSAYGECRGRDLDALIDQSLVQVSNVPPGCDENYARVSITPIGQAIVVGLQKENNP